MANVFRKRGFDAHKKETERRKKESEARQGKLWRFFLKDNDEDVPLRFLTEEPILFYEHNVTLPGGKYGTVTCNGGEDCEECARGDRPSYKGAWLVVDGRSFEIDEKKDGKATGKKKTIKDQVRLYVRGATDIAKLDRLSKKYGLTSRPWFATKTGKDTSTSYELDRGDESELTEKEIKNLLAKVPEEMKDHYDGTEDSLYDIVEFNIFDDVELGQGSSDTSDEDEEDEDVDVDEDVEDVEEEEEEAPKKKKIGKKKLGAKKPLAKKSTSEDKKPAKKKGVFKRK